MFCPGCGSTNGNDQKFCRACGLDLEDSIRSLDEQLAGQDFGTAKRKRIVERILFSLGGIGFTAFVILIVSTIITEIIVGKGNIVGGIIFIAFILGIAVFALLVLYRESLSDAKRKTHPQASASGLSAQDTTKLIERSSEPALSVTDETTRELELVNRKRP
jgi:hypothetical protein